MSSDSEVSSANSISEDEEEIAQVTKSKKASKKKRRHADDGDRPRKKKSRLRGCDFILDDVDVDDDDDEGFDDFDDAEDLGIDPREHAEAERFLRQQELRANSHRRPLFEDIDEEHMDDYFKERYNLQAHRPSSSVQCDEIAQQSLVPTAKDPNLWIVRCQLGAEQAAVLQVMRKFIAMSRTSNPLLIKSAFVRHSMKGKGLIYVEAFKRNHVVTAIEGIRALSFGNTNVPMVPRKELTGTLKVVNTIPEMQVGDYVRVLRTVYKGDLGQVDLIDSARGRVDLRLVPRIDFTRKRGHLREPDDRGRARYTGPFRRPMPKLFDAEKIREIGGFVTESGSFQHFEGNRYLDGFLYKTFQLSQISTEDVQPSVTELKMFESDGTDGLDLSEVKVRTGRTTHSYISGDAVQIIKGEMVGLNGVVRKIDGDNIVMFPHHPMLNEEIIVSADELQKYFKLGDQIKVISGTHKDVAGFVAKVEEHTLVVVTYGNGSSNEVKVLKKDAQLAR